MQGEDELNGSKSHFKELEEQASRPMFLSTLRLIQGDLIMKYRRGMKMQETAELEEKRIQTLRNTTQHTV